MLASFNWRPLKPEKNVWSAKLRNSNLTYDLKPLAKKANNIIFQFVGTDILIFVHVIVDMDRA